MTPLNLRETQHVGQAKNILGDTDVPQRAFWSNNALPFRSLEFEKGLLQKRIEGLLADTRDHGLLSAAAEDSVTPRAADAIRLLRQRVEQMGQQLQASTVPSALTEQHICSTPTPHAALMLEDVLGKPNACRTFSTFKLQQQIASGFRMFETFQWWFSCTLS